MKRTHQLQSPVHFHKLHNTTTLNHLMIYVSLKEPPATDTSILVKKIKCFCAFRSTSVCCCLKQFNLMKSYRTGHIKPPYSVSGRDIHTFNKLKLEVCTFSKFIYTVKCEMVAHFRSSLRCWINISTKMWQKKKKTSNAASRRLPTGTELGILTHKRGFDALCVWPTNTKVM